MLLAAALLVAPADACRVAADLHTSPPRELAAAKPATAGAARNAPGVVDGGDLRWVHLFLLRSSEAAPADRTRYVLKALDPASGGVRVVCEVLLPRVLHSAAYPRVQYSEGRLYYQPAGQDLAPGGVLLALDLESGREVRALELEQDLAAGTSVLESWRIAAGECVFVE